MNESRRSNARGKWLAAALLVAGGWWVLLVELTPATSRPYVGGSQTDSVLELALGYNGFGRLTGDEVGSVGGGAGWGEPGLTRLFGGEMGSEIAWLLPAALIALGWALWGTRGAPRTDRTRAALLLWGGWLRVTGVVFSFMSGIVHAYYAVMLAPPIAALVGIGAALAWRLNYRASAVGVLAAAVAGMAVVMYFNADPDASLLNVAVFFGFTVAIGGLTVRLYRALFTTPRPAVGHPGPAPAVDGERAVADLLRLGERHRLARVRVGQHARDDAGELQAQSARDTEDARTVIARAPPLRSPPR